MSNTYLRYLLKEHKKSIIIIYIIVSLLTVSSVLFTYIDPEEVPLFYSHVVVSYANSLVGFLTFILLLFVPLSRSMFFKKQTVDMFFSIPVTKKEIAITTSVFTYLSILILFLPLFLLGPVFFLIKGIQYNIGAYFAYLPLALVQLTFFSSLINLATSLSNSIIDSFATSMTMNGALFSFLAVVLLIVLPFLNEQEQMSLAYKYLTSLTYSGLDNNIQEFTESIQTFDSFAYSGPLILSFVISIVKIPGYAYLSNYFASKYKAEDASTPSRNKYGIRNQILPIYFLVGLLVGIFSYSLIDSLKELAILIGILFVFTSIGIYLVEAFVNRSFKFKKDTLLRMIIPFIGGILIGVIYMAIFNDKINMIFGSSL